jgi:hypothetical protein
VTASCPDSTTALLLNQALASYTFPGVAGTSVGSDNQRDWAVGGWVETIFSECVGECAASVAQLNVAVPFDEYVGRGSVSKFRGAGARFGPLGAAVTGPTAADSAVVEPAMFVAVTRKRSVESTSAVSGAYVVAVAPAIGAQAAPSPSQRSHRYASVGVPVQVPLVALSVSPTLGVPATAGGTVLAGGDLIDFAAWYGASDGVPDENCVPPAPSRVSTPMVADAP